MKWLPKCLKSTMPYSVIVIDNGSTDGTTDYILSNYPNVNILRQKKNIGFGQANNIGISYALKEGADYVFLLNQDAYLQKGSLDKLVQRHKNNKDYGILSPIHLNGTGTRLDVGFSNYVNYAGDIDFYSNYILDNSTKPIYNLPFVNAAGWLVSRECLKNIGGFDPIFFHYGEDVNFCQRVIYHGFKIGIVPDAKIFHDRENRNKKIVINGSEEHFKILERDLKIKLANLNLPWTNEFENLIVKRKKGVLNSLLKLKLNEVLLFQKEIFILQRLKRKIQISRKINVLRNYNYLN